MTILSSSSLSDTQVVNNQGEDLGTIKDFMLDVTDGKVTYAVLKFGSFLGMGGKLFAVPLAAMRVDTENKQFILDQSKEALKNAPGFDEDRWPNFSDRKWSTSIHSYYKLPGKW